MSERRSRRRRRLTLAALPPLFRAAFLSWNEDKATRLAAALAYYTVFSIPPFLILMIGALGSIFDHDPVQERVVRSIQHLVGPQGADAIRQILDSVHRERNPGRATVIGIITLLLGASGIFGNLRDSLNTVWEVEPTRSPGIGTFARHYVFSIMVLLVTGFLLLVSLALNALLAVAGDYLGRALPGGAALWQLFNAGFSLAVIAFLFALMFRYIPDAIVAWGDALLGGAMTAILFTVGESLIGLYLGRTNVASAFGVAGSLVVLLIWVYYSSMIFFFGAEFTKAYADRFGAPIVPEAHAAPMTTEAREQQGIPKQP